MAPPKPPTYSLEAPTRLSESLLWRLQKNFFAAAGATAWSRGIVPHYVTSNSWVAGAYARVVLGWLRDVTAAGGSIPATRSTSWSWDAARGASAITSSPAFSTSSAARRCAA